MPNMLDYLKWRGDLTFDASPFNEVDNIILSMLSFVDYSVVIPEPFLPIPVPMPVRLDRCYDEIKQKFPNGLDFGQIIPEKTNDLFAAAAKSVRFRDVYVSGYKYIFDETEFVQFAAVTFVLPDDTIFISFRGTDDSLVGWREDFNISFSHPVRSQLLAAEYVDETASVYRGNIRLGGHSKGGNLALYAAAFAKPENGDRIIAAYSNDGPGFVSEIKNSPEFKRTEERMLTITPQSSVIGMLLERGDRCEIVESNLKNGLMQHNPFSWEVMGKEFIHLPCLSPRGKRHDEVFREWLGKLNAEKRKEFTEILFGVLGSTGAKTVSDLSVDHLPKLMTAIRAFSELDREEKEVMSEFVRGLFDAMKKQGTAE